MDAIQIIQAIVGLVLFFGAGYSLTLFLFRKDEIDLVERITYSIALSLTVPAIIIFAANFLLKMKIDALSVYIIYLLVTASGFIYSEYFLKKKQAHAKGA